MEKAKNVRRAAKGNFTRTLNAGNMLIEAKRPVQEVREAFAEVKATHNDLVAKHETYTMHLNDEEYEEAEVWMDNCTREYITFSMLVNDNTDNTSDHEGHEFIQDDNEAHNSDNVSHEKEEHIESAEGSAKPVILKHEKLKLPCFYGDVRKYFFFIDDFKHAVENQRNARDTIAIEGISSDLKAAWKSLIITTEIRE